MSVGVTQPIPYALCSFISYETQKFPSLRFSLPIRLLRSTPCPLTHLPCPPLYYRFVPFSHMEGKVHPHRLPSKHTNCCPKQSVWHTLLYLWPHRFLSGPAAYLYPYAFCRSHPKVTYLDDSSFLSKRGVLFCTLRSESLWTSFFLSLLWKLVYSTVCLLYYICHSTGYNENCPYWQPVHSQT